MSPQEESAAPRFRGGRNIALKVPPDQWEATVRFYREVLGLPEVKARAPDVVFEFGSCHLWIDRVEALSQAELWLEVDTDDTNAAARHLERAGVVRRDGIEPLGEIDGFWISSPASIIHLVRNPQAEDD